MASTSGADVAQQRWEVENAVSTSTDADAYYQYDPEEQAAIQREKPWKKDPHYFKSVRISALALLKMAMHAKSGGNLEVMGMMQGKVQGGTFIVLDAFALPVEGTETRVNAQEEAYEFMVAYNHASKQINRPENVVGWYHSHPGYGCWLSGIDCSTQMAQQMYQDPFLAVVVDPHRTIAAGKVEIGAFRTYPEGYKPPDAGQSEYQTIPLNKIEDFGVHCKQYYALDVSFFKSSTDGYLLDLLWNKYWANMLSASPLLAMYDLTNGQIADIGEKLEKALASTSTSAGMGRFVGAADAKNKEDRPLNKVCQDAKHLAVEQIKGLSSQVVKSLLFNHRLGHSCAPEPESMAL